MTRTLFTGATILAVSFALGQGFGLLIGLDEPNSNVAALPEISATDSLPNLVVATRSGEQVRLSDLHGSRGAVLIVFSTNCGMAFAEAMVWQRLSDRLEDLPLVALTTDAEWDAVDELKRRARLTFPLATLTPSQARAAGVVGYPTIVAIERSGKVMFVSSGAGATAAFEEWALTAGDTPDQSPGDAPG